MDNQCLGSELDRIDGNIVHAGNLIDNANPLDWDKLSSALTEYDYNLYVHDNNNMVFSSLDKEQDTIIKNLQKFDTDSILLIGKIENLTIAAKIYDGYSMYAIKGTPQTNNFFGKFMSLFIMVCVVIAAAILTFSHFLPIKWHGVYGYILLHVVKAKFNMAAVQFQKLRVHKLGGVIITGIFHHLAARIGTTSDVFHCFGWVDVV